MFSSQRRDELVFGNHIKTTVCQPEDNMLFADDLVVDYTYDPPIKNIIDFSSTQKPELQTQLGDTNQREKGMRKIKPIDEREKEIMKIKHRDSERKRREEMSKLYASLRSLLPLVPNKGKLTKPDYMQEAVNYTKQLQKKVQELRTRREMLQNLYTSSGTRNITSSIGTDHNLPNCVTLNVEKDGMEILISSTSFEFRLSNVIKELHGKGLNVASSVSTKINGGFIHKIQAEFSDMRVIDLSRLQQRLTEMINYPR